jgi:ribosomal protein S18 acetylase RimI-like enzyme
LTVRAEPDVKGINQVVVRWVCCNDRPVMEVRSFEPDDLHGVLRLCEAEGWPSFPADAARALRILTAPGVTTVVAVDNGGVVGFAELFSDGELQAFLANLAVDSAKRGAGIGRQLVAEALRQAGGERVDLLSEEDAAGFYRTFANFEKPGFRLYPFYEGG